MRWHLLRLSLQHPFSQLLFILVTLVSVGVLLRFNAIETIVISFILLTSLLQAIKIVNPPRRISHVLLWLSVITFGIILTTEFGVFRAFTGINTALRILALISLAIFLGSVISLIIRTLLRQSEVTGDLVKGGICIYFLVAVLWSFLYQATAIFDPQAFLFIPENQGQNPYVYFSFITLTSTGFGDIIPINPIAKLLAGFEAMFGQLYVAIVIARLVSLYASQNSSRS